MPTDASELFTYWAASTLLMGIEPLSLVAVLVLLAISFFYHGSLDPRLTIRRATIVSILLALGGLAFVVAERYVVAAIVQALGLSHDVTWAVAGLVAGGVVVPARRIVDSGVRTLIDRITPATDLADGEPMDAAVVFSDLSGFTALSARDERAGIVAASLLHKMAREVARERRGRLVKTVGDATVMEFESADDAVAATHALHERYAKGSEVLGLPALAVHSGINAGKYVKAHDGDIYGSTVNLAARLQDAAGAGEVVVSQEVHKRVTSSAFRWVDLGARDFKNLPVPVPVLRLVAG
jgi:class 3 adenylate cyclase